MGITHATVATGTDAGTGDIHKAEWNAAHTGADFALLEQHAASSSASLDFTTFISATYDTYQFEIIDLVPATSTAVLWMRMGTGGGPTFDTGANYGWQLFRHSFNANATSGGDSAETKIVLTTKWLSTGVHPIDGSFKLYGPSSTSWFKFTHGNFVYPDSDLGNMATSDIAGQYNSTTAVTGIQFLMSSGNLTSGTIRVYGLGK